MTQPCSPRFVRIVRLSVGSDRVTCDLAVSSDVPHDSTPQLADLLAKRLPTLPEHACVNELGETFGVVMAHTPLPHVLEHLVIDLQVRAETERASALSGGSEVGAAPVSPDSAAVFVGTSEWTDEAAGCARVAVSFTDDLVALRAFRDAEHILNEAMLLCAHGNSTHNIRHF